MCLMYDLEAFHCITRTSTYLLNAVFWRRDPGLHKQTAQNDDHSPRALLENTISDCIQKLFHGILTRATSIILEMQLSQHGQSLLAFNILILNRRQFITHATLNVCVALMKVFVKNGPDGVVNVKTHSKHNYQHRLWNNLLK